MTKTTFFLIITVLAFICEYIDSSIGMGYGTTLTPLLLIIGIQPLQAVPAVLISQLSSGLVASFFHHEFKNVNFNLGSIDTKVTFVLAICGIIGATTAVLVAIRLSSFILRIYIGSMVLTVGILTLTVKVKTNFSWKKILSLGLISSFNKGISGGGYGPILMCGQILSGTESKHAIGRTTLAEAVTCLASSLIYIATHVVIYWNIVIPLIIGSILATPLSAYTVKKIEEKKFKNLVGYASITLGIITLIKIFI